MASQRYMELRYLSGDPPQKDMHNNHLLRACQNDSDLMGEFLQENREFIFSILKKYKGNIHELEKRFNVEEEELLQIACIGVITALKDFDFGRGYKFTTFAVRPILWEVNQFLYSDSQLVRLSRGAIDLIKRVKEVEDSLGYLPDEDELSHLLNIPKERILDTLRFTQDMADIDDVYTSSIMQDTGYSVEEEVVMRVYTKQLLEDSGLTEEELLICNMIMNEGLNNSQIAERLGKYPMTINRIIMRIQSKFNRTYSDDRRHSKYDDEINLLVEEMKEIEEYISVDNMKELLNVCGYKIEEYTPRILYYIRQKSILKLNNEGGFTDDL